MSVDSIAPPIPNKAMNDSHIAHRIRHVFRKNGRAGQFLMECETLDPPVMQSIREAFPIAPNELPVIGMVRSEIVMLLTTRHLFYRDSARVLQLPLSSIIGIVPDLTLDIMAPRDFSQRQVDKVTVELDGGQKHNLELEAGPPFAAVLSALRAAVFDAGKIARAGHDESGLS